MEIIRETEVNIERKPVGGDPRYTNGYLEWIYSQKRKSYDAYDSNG